MGLLGCNLDSGALDSNGKHLGVCLMMEFAEGGDLEGYIEKQSASWSWLERLRLLHEVGLGMSVLHDGIVSIVHRDLKASRAVYVLLTYIKRCTN